MPVFVECPSGHRLKVPSKHAGVRIICPVCEQSFVVPPVAADETPPPQRAQPTASPLPSPAPPAANAVNRKRVRRDLEKTDQVSANQDRLEPAASPVEDTSSHTEAVPSNAEDLPRPRSVSSEEERNVNPQQSTPGPPPTLDQATMPADVVDEATNVTSMTDAGAEEVGVALPVIDVEFDSQTVVTGDPESQSDESGHSEFAIRPLDEPTTNSLGVHSDAEFPKNQAWTAWGLGVAALIVAGVCAVPALLQLVASQRGFTTGPADSWTYYVLLGALIQAAVALYAMNLPDWTTTWIACLTTVGLATLYAMGLALTMFASQEHSLVQQLGLLDESYRGKSQPWCFLATCLSLMLAYAYGRFSVRWMQVEKQLLSSRNAA